ncbi:Sedlin [Penicillium expansum]|nr:Sedlin [Penicillium expansum]
MAGPKIACIGVIGKAVCISLCPLVPLRLITLFTFPCFPIFGFHYRILLLTEFLPRHFRHPDLGLLHAIDERLAAYGWLTTTGVKLLIIVDLFGQEEASSGKQAGAAINGLRDSDVKPAFRALQSAYIQLLQNPFYSPDDHIPIPGNTASSLSACQPISNKKFVADVKRIGDLWAPGTSL